MSTRLTLPLLPAALAALTACAAQPLPSPAPSLAEEPIPAFWRGAFSMVEVRGAPMAGQFRLELGRQGPNHFRASRGCYVHEGSLKRRGALWIVEPAGVRADEQCLSQGHYGHARGVPDHLFQHKAVTLSPLGPQRWISEGSARWLYLQNPPSPPQPR